MWDLQHVPAPRGAREWVLLGPVLQGPKGKRDRIGTEMEMDEMRVG